MSWRSCLWSAVSDSCLRARPIRGQSVADGRRRISDIGLFMSVTSAWQGQTMNTVLGTTLGELGDDQKTQRLGAILAIVGGCLALGGAILAAL
jgi:hypothetical protein